MFKKIFGPLFYINNFWLYYLDFFHLLKRKKISYSLRNNKKLYAIPNTFDSRIINEIWGEKVYELNRFTLGNKPTIVDIGAHKGYFSIFIANKFKDAKVIAVEPLKTNHTVLRENVKLNNFKNITVYPNGISDKKETRELYTPASNSGGISMIKDWFVAEKNLQTFNMECITFSDLLKKEKITTIDLLKLDVEGGEYSILSSIKAAQFKNIKNITMEYHQIGNLKVGKIKKILKENNFSFEVVPVNETIGMLYATRTS